MLHLIYAFWYSILNFWNVFIREFRRGMVNEEIDNDTTPLNGFSPATERTYGRTLYFDDDQQAPPIIATEVRQVVTEPHHERQINSLLDFSSGRDLRAHCISLTVRTTALLTSLATCTENSQIVASLVQFAASFVTGDNVKLLLEIWDAPVEQAGLAANLRNWSNMAKSSWAHAKLSPMCTGVTNFLALAIITEFLEKDKIKLDIGKFRIINAEWVKTVALEHMSDPISLVMECVTFAIDIVEAIEMGDWDSLIRPTSVISEVASLRSMADDWRNGLIEERHNVKTVIYEVRLKQVIVDLSYRVKMDGPKAIIWANMLTEMDKIYHEVKARNAMSRSRPASFCYLLYGKSGVGKSTLMRQINTYLMTAKGYKPDSSGTMDNIFATINFKEDHESTITAEKKVFEVDDAGHSKDDKLAEWLIENINNNPAYARRAEIGGKGAIPKEQELTSLTTNFIEAGLTKQEVYLAAAVGRLHEKWEVKVRPEFANSKGGLDSLKAAQRPDEDPHMLRRYEIVCHRNNTFSVQRANEWLSFEGFMKHMFQAMKIHERNQGFALEALKKARKVKVCNGCNIPEKFCQCRRHERVVEEVFGHRNVALPVWVSEFILDWTYPFRDMMYHGFMDLLINRVNTFLVSQIIHNRITAGVLLFLSFSLTLIIPWVAHWKFTLLWTFLFAYLLLMLFAYVIAIRRYVGKRLAESFLSGEQPRAMISYFGYGFMSMMAIHTLARVTSMGMETQGAIVNPTPEEIDERKKEENHFFPMVVDNPSPPIVGSTQEQFQKLIQYNVAWATGRAKEESADGILAVFRKKNPEEKFNAANAVFLKDNYAIMNTHVLASIDLKEKVRFNYGGLKDTKDSHVEIISQIGDISLVRVPEALCHTDITKYISYDQHFRDKRTWLFGRRSGGISNVIKFRSEPVSIVNDKHPLPGWCSTPDTGYGKTQYGDCGSILVTAEGPPYIIGFHCAGSELSNRCYAASTPPDLLKVQQMLRSVDGTISNPMLNYATPHPRAPVYYGIADEAGDAPLFATLGACPELRARAKTSVKRTVISPTLEANGIPCKWGPPKFDPNRNHSACFQVATHPMSSFDPRALRWAIEDYVGDILNYVSENLDFFSTRFQPLNDFEMINGREDSKFMRPMNLKTSGGIGYRGKKIDHVDEHVDEETGKKTFSMQEHLSENCTNLYDKLASGVRSCPIFKSCLKDEPTKLLDRDGNENTKVRLFFTMPFDFLAVGRKLLLPVVEVLSSLPLMSECAVGIQSESEEWGQLANYLSGYGDNIMEGDYSKYDMRISSGLIRAVAEIFQRIAEMLGYEPDQLIAMNAWFADVTNPIYAFNGTYVMFYGFNPSGNPITVYMNCIVNSLLHRMFYFELCELHYSKVPGCFRDNIRLITYGDDSLASVRQFLAFNMKNFQVFLARHKMPYTDASKSAVVPPFTTLAEAEFCKRRFLWLPELRTWSAPLLVDSIIKALHCTIGTSEPEMHALDELCNALHKFSFYDETTFDQWRAFIRHIASAHGWENSVRKLDWAYADWWEHRMCRYAYSDVDIARLRGSDLSIRYPIGEIQEEVDSDDKPGEIVCSDEQPSDDSVADTASMY